MSFLKDPSTRRILRRLPGVRRVKKAANKARRAYYRRFGRSWLKRKLAASERKRIVIGAGSRFDPGWIPTQQEFLDVTDPTQWEAYFEPNSVEAMLAEHVWEHLTLEDGLAAARACFRYLGPGGTLRIAVVMYEYFDEAGSFHCQDWDAKGGTVWRSKRFDPRNKGGKLASVYPGTLDDYLAFSSIVLDAVKDRTPGR
jgi:predicted SAM-dependent methyltransferase